LQGQLDGLKQVQETISQQQVLDHQTIRLVNPFPYRVLWDLKSVAWQRESGLIIMAAFLLFTAGLFSADQQGSTAALLHSLPDGRQRLVLSRLAGAICLSSVFSLICMLIVMIRQFRVSGFPSMLADRLTTLPWFSAACGNLPIWSGLVFFFAVNLIMQTSVLLLALWLGSLKGLGVAQTILVLLVLFVLPAILLLNSAYQAGLLTILAITSAWSTLVYHPWVLLIWLVIALSAVIDLLRRYGRQRP
jgi:mannitol-specific phosphotransferase system IIBC component